MADAGFPALLPNYNRAAIAFERGEGTYVYSTDGRRFLDFMAGIAVNCLGHCHPHLVETLTTQGGKIWHTSNIFEVPNQARLAERMVAATFADTAYFCNSGAEAIECGIKMIRKYHHDRGDHRKTRVICANNAFHGRTLATIAAGGQEKLTAGFEPVVEGFDHVAFNNLNELRAAITEETGGILIEPIQGEGGIVPASPEYLRGLRAVADEFGLILMFDEIQCGMGRTGTLFFHEQAGMAPDVMAVAKGVGGGFPLGACLATAALGAGMKPGTHGSTYGGNPLATAIGNAVLDVVLADGFLDRVAATATGLRARLDDLVARHPAVFEDVRGVGLMIGLKTRVANTDMVAALRENGLLVAGAGGNVVRLLPPLIVGEAEIDEALAILDQTASALAGQDG